MKRYFLFAALFLFTIGILGCPAPKIAKKGCVDCHADEYARLSKGNVHKPVLDKNCEGCHIPHGLLGAVILKADDSFLCYTCHEKDRPKLEKGSVHPPLKEGKCLVCHNPHSSPFKGITRIGGNDLCYNCHPKEGFAKKTVHKALEEGCDRCHNAHSSEHGYNLIDAGNKLCLNCHKPESERLIAAHSGYNAAGADCLSCHTPHAADKDELARNFGHSPF